MSDHLPAYAQYDLFFSPQRISALKDIRGEKWRALVAKVVVLPDISPDALALSYTMIQLCGCETCEKDSYRAQLGCATCARRTLQGFKGPDDELLHRFETAQSTVVIQLVSL